MKKHFDIIVMMFLMMLPASVVAAKFNQMCYTTVNGTSRSYWLYVPDNISGETPLVFSLHGTGCRATDKSPFRTDVADKAKCIVVYPQGQTIHFPVFGADLPGWRSTGETSEDIDFFKQVIEEVAGKYTIDRKRIYCCGFSNGGMMTYTVANVASDVFAAFASISGYPINEFHLHHSGMRPVPFLHIHGKADDFVRYVHMPTIVDEMVARNGCNPVATKTSGWGYDKSVFAAGEGGFPYIYYEINGMGHNDFTNATEDGNSAQTMWNFMSQYTLDSKCDTTLKWRPAVESSNWNAAAHGFTLNSGRTLLSFGGDQYTQANQNVYHSIQLENGSYQLRLHVSGTSANSVTLQLKNITSGKYLVNTTSEAGKDIVADFKVSEGWGECKLDILRENSSASLSISNLAIYEKSENTGVNAAIAEAGTSKAQYYTISGIKVVNPSKGVFIKKNGNKTSKVILK